MNCEVLFNPDQKTLFKSLAKTIFDFLAQDNAPNLAIAIPGGRSVVGLLEAMTADAQLLPNQVWARCHFFMTDERLVPLDDKESNFRLLKEKLFDGLLSARLIKPNQLHPVGVSLASTDEIISSYSTELRKVSDRYSVAIYGVGEDAHVGALFPNHHSMQEAGDFIAMEDSPKPPPKRFSSSRSLLERSSMAVGLFVGEGKRVALARFNDPSVTLVECPAKLILKAQRGIVATDLK